MVRSFKNSAKHETGSEVEGSDNLDRTHCILRQVSYQKKILPERDIWRLSTHEVRDQEKNHSYGRRINKDDKECDYYSNVFTNDFKSLRMYKNIHIFLIDDSRKCFLLFTHASITLVQN